MLIYFLTRFWKKYKVMHNVQVVLPPTLNINFKFVSIDHFIIKFKQHKNAMFIVYLNYQICHVFKRHVDLGLSKNILKKQDLGLFYTLSHHHL